MLIVAEIAGLVVTGFFAGMALVAGAGNHTEDAKVMALLAIAMAIITAGLLNV